MERFVGISVPPLTLITNPVIMEIGLQRGKLFRVLVTFPAGCAGLVYASLFVHGEQIAPWNPTGSLRGNDLTIEAVRDYPVDQPPFEMVVKAWSEDDTYTHTVLVDIMETEEIVRSVAEQVLGL
jgi:hypothetical protein